MATQSLTEENSDLSENEDVQEIEDPILVAVNAGASLRSPTSAVIARKRKLPANERYQRKCDCFALRWSNLFFQEE